ncbi:hypothetical protein AVEN_145289-1 [Araneus ventricosus]|uniref:Uncharacterized protein n=1 Tax=Araneus ventricosus TaxID=182803 RepID=A0A4Y2H1M4_ARAVE|nr:hypothetical protein AVEN_145289-1 [Araneus ventricosus]
MAYVNLIVEDLNLEFLMNLHVLDLPDSEINNIWNYVCECDITKTEHTRQMKFTMCPRNVGFGTKALGEKSICLYVYYVGRVPFHLDRMDPQIDGGL